MYARQILACVVTRDREAVTLTDLSDFEDGDVLVGWIASACRNARQNDVFAAQRNGEVNWRMFDEYEQAIQWLAESRDPSVFVYQITDQSPPHVEQLIELVQEFGRQADGTFENASGQEFWYANELLDFFFDFAFEGVEPELIKWLRSLDPDCICCIDA